MDEIENSPDQPTDNLAENPEGESGSAEKTEAAIPAAEYSLEEDLEILERINVLKSVMIQMQGGRHFDPQIDALLKRRINLRSEDFQGPYLIRLVVTLMMIFVISALFWSVLWILASGFQMNYFIKMLSTGMGTLVAALAGVAIFHPSSVPDESLLKQFIDDKLNKLKKEARQKSGVGEKREQSDKDLIDDSIEVKIAAKEAARTDEYQGLSSMPDGLSNTRPLEDDNLSQDNKNLSPDEELSQPDEESEPDNQNP